MHEYRSNIRGPGIVSRENERTWVGVKVGRFVSGNSPTCLLTIKSGQLSFRPTPSLVRYPLPLVYIAPFLLGGGKS